MPTHVFVLLHEVALLKGVNTLFISSIMLIFVKCYNNFTLVVDIHCAAIVPIYAVVSVCRTNTSKYIIPFTDPKRELLQLSCTCKQHGIIWTRGNRLRAIVRRIEVIGQTRTTSCGCSFRWIFPTSLKLHICFSYHGVNSEWNECFCIFFFLIRIIPGICEDIKGSCCLHVHDNCSNSLLGSVKGIRICLIQVIN
jgi:hypothetical protein